VIFSIFSTREQQRSELRKEFVAFLESKKALDAARSQFISFLRSDEGKQLLIDLLVEALAGRELAPIVNSAETRLKNVATHAETILEASAASHADALKGKVRQLAQDIASRANKDVRDCLSSYQREIAEAVREQLPIILREEIALDVSLRRSNREIARDYSMSIREVKRVRRGWRPSRRPARPSR
jgi:hypothetical protein